MLLFKRLFILQNAKQKAHKIGMIFGLLFVGLLSACSVQPLYKGTSGGDGSVEFNVEPSIKEKLSAISVLPANDVFNQMVRNELLFLLYGGKEAPINSRYQLVLNASYSVTTAVQLDIGDTTDRTGRASAGTVVGKGSYQLKNMQGQILTKNNRTVYASFDRPRQEYANLQAEKNATQRAAHELAEQIFLALAQKIAKL